MTAPLRLTVLDWFRSQKQEPMIQFLTWYIVLVLEWKFEEMTNLTISTMEPIWHTTRWKCIFTFQNGNTTALIVAMNSDGNFYADVRFSVIQPAQPSEQERRGTPS